MAADTSNDRTNQARASLISDTTQGGSFGSELTAGNTTRSADPTSGKTLGA